MTKSPPHNSISFFPKGITLYILGIVLTILIIVLKTNGFLAIWHRVPTPPDDTIEILTVPMNATLFIRTVEGQVYSLDKRLKIGWEPVYEQIYSNPYLSCDLKSESHPAFFWFRNKIADCQIARMSYEWVADDYVYVLLNNGKIYQWHYRNGIDVWLLMLCAGPFVVMFLGLLLIRIFRR